MRMQVIAALLLPALQERTWRPSHSFSILTLSEAIQ